MYTGILIMTLLILQVFLPGFPKELLLVQAGSNYGFILGSLINWLGMILGAQLAYEFAGLYRSLFGRLYSLNSDKVIQLNEYLQNKGAWGLFYMRLIPFSPNDILSFLSGFIRINRWQYILVSLFTAIPYAMVFAYLGNKSAEYTAINQYLLPINLTILVITSFISIYYWISWRNSSNE